MSDLNISMDGGTSIRLLTEGKYCDRNIVVTASGGGGGSAGSVSPKAVNFRDYDGTVLHSYTKDEALALTALPELPTRAGLICQEWNWSLADMQSYVADYGICEVGATYITDDGKTRLYITIAAEGRMTVPLFFSQTAANGVTIDWGDGSATETLSGTGKVNTTHTYASVGDYVISLEVADGCTLSLGHGASGYCVMGTIENAYCNMLQKVEIGNSVTSIGIYAFDYCYSLTSVVIPNSVTSIGNYAFMRCYSLASINIPNGVTSIAQGMVTLCYSLASVVIPNGVTSIGSNAFSHCDALTSVVIPNGVTSIGDSVFQYCNSLTSLVIPNGVTSIGQNVFESCYSLASINIPNGVTRIGQKAFQKCYSLASINIPNSVTKIDQYTFSECHSLASINIPNSVTSIGNYAFQNCKGMAFYDFTSHTAVPTLSSSNPFNNIPSDCEHRVPAALAETWKAATNWSTYADKIVEG